MINPAPLLIVMGTILGLLAVQRLLSRAPLPGPENQQATPVPTPPPRPRGRKLVEGISITGLDERGVASLKALIAKNEFYKAPA